MILTGECAHCGACCHGVTINGVEPVDGYCHMFDHEKRRCGGYEKRPEVCREWPRSPETLRGAVDCTLKFVELEVCHR